MWRRQKHNMLSLLHAACLKLLFIFSITIRILSLRDAFILFPNYIYNRLPEDEPSGSTHVEDIKKLKY